MATTARKAKHTKSSNYERDTPILCWQGIWPVHDQRVLTVLAKGNSVQPPLHAAKISRFHEVLQQTLQSINSVFGCCLPGLQPFDLDLGVPRVVFLRLDVVCDIVDRRSERLEVV